MDRDEDLVAFCDREHARLVAALALYTGDHNAAEELAQDALVRLCQHWPRVSRMSHPEGWLYRVAFNLARSMFRRRAAGRRAMARHGPDVDHHDAETATTLAVRQAVAALPPRMREVVIRRHLLECTVQETADAMGCAEGTVKSLTHKALAQLRDSGLDDARHATPQEICP